MGRVEVIEEVELDRGSLILHNLQQLAQLRAVYNQGGASVSATLAMEDLEDPYLQKFKMENGNDMSQLTMLTKCEQRLWTEYWNLFTSEIEATKAVE